MADEVLINRLYDIVDEITRIGGEQENTSITPGVEVTNANPGDLPTGYIKIVNPRDGTYVPCLTVNGLVVADNDLLNVLFTKGTEPIALSQSSQSPSSSLKVSEVWDAGFDSVVLQITDAEDVGIGTAGPDAKLDILDTAGAQLRLTHTDGSKFTDFTLDTNHDLLIKPSSTGQIKLQPTTDSADFFQVLDSDGGTPILNIDSTNERVGIGNAAPTTTLDISGTVTITDDILHAGDTDTKMSFTTDDIEFTVGNLSMLKLTETTQDLITLGPGSGDVDIDFNGDMFLQGSDGNFGIATTTPPAPLSIMDSGANETTANFSEALGVYSDGILNVTASRSSTNAFGATWLTLKSRGTHASKTAVSNGDEIGLFVFYGYQNGAYRSAASIKAIVDNAPAGSVVSGRLGFFTTDTGGSANENVVIKSDGKMGINGVTSPSTELDIGAGAIEFDEMTAPSAGAANTARLFTQDNGAGKTQLAVRFNTGAIQIIATEP